MWYDSGVCTVRVSFTIGALGAASIGEWGFECFALLWRDFNAVISLEEHRHCVGDKRCMAGFASFVEEVYLLDLPTSEKMFTWFGAGLKTSRLDHFLVSLAWVEQFRGLEQGHVKLMELEWHRISEEASSPLSTLEKLRLLNGFLKVWNRESFGSVNLQIEVTTDLLNDLEGRDEGVEELHETRRQLQGNLWKLLRYRSSIWRQKSRVMWL
ncbi:hypothetical protein V6N13_101244 [Hibiscus sabdariffa]